MVKTHSLFLIGLPGCGKTTVVEKLQAFQRNAALGGVNVAVRESVGFDFAVQPEEQACLVWDAREQFDAYEPDWLQSFFAQTEQVMVTHWTTLDLMAQSQFNQQLKTWFKGRVFFADTLTPAKAMSLLSAESDSALNSASNLFEQDLVVLEVSIGRVVLDHLLFVLEMAQQNHQRPIWRAEGTLLTQEYVNPVVLDMTRSQLRTEGLQLKSGTEPQLLLGQLTFWLDKSIDPVQVQDWLTATLAPGERIVI